MGDYGTRARLTTDARGRFTVATKMAARPVRLWASAGGLLSSRGVVAIGGDEVALRLGEKNEVTVGARVQSKDGKPLPNIEVALMSLSGNVATRTAQAKTDAQGRVRFERQRTATAYWLRVQQPGYAPGYADIAPLQPGERAEETIKLERADSFVAGRVLHANGRPAASQQVWASGVLRGVVTDASGGFRLSNVLRGPVTINVSPLSGGQPSSSTRVQSGRSDVRITLARATKSTTPAWGQGAGIGSASRRGRRLCWGARRPRFKPRAGSTRLLCRCASCEARSCCCTSGTASSSPIVPWPPRSRDRTGLRASGTARHRHPPFACASPSEARADDAP
jgi:hypothetical protein